MIVGVLSWRVVFLVVFLVLIILHTDFKRLKLEQIILTDS